MQTNWHHACMTIYTGMHVNAEVMHRRRRRGYTAGFSAGQGMQGSTAVSLALGGSIIRHRSKLLTMT